MNPRGVSRGGSVLLAQESREREFARLEGQGGGAVGVHIRGLHPTELHDTLMTANKWEHNPNGSAL